MNTKTHNKRKLSVAATAMLAGVAIVATPLASMPSFAAAIDADDAKTYGVATSATYLGIYQYGTWNEIPNNRAICLDNGRAESDTYGDPSEVYDAEYSYLLWKHLETQSNIDAAALAALGKERHGNHRPGHSVDAALNGTSQGGAIRARMAQLREEARIFAGPYDIKLDVPQTKANPGEQVTASVTVKSHLGAGMQGVEVTFAWGGAAADSGLKYATTNEYGVAEISFTAGDSGSSLEVDASIGGRGLPAGNIRVWQPQEPEDVAPAFQRMVSEADRFMWQDNTNNPVRVENEMGITTVSTASQSQLEVGDTITDRIQIINGAPNKDYTILARLYGPMDSKPATAGTPGIGSRTSEAPAGAPLFATQEITISTDAAGQAVHEITSPMITEPGWYSFDTDYAGEPGFAPYDAGFGVDDETGELINYNPEVTTMTSDTFVGEDTDSLTDMVMVTGGKPGASFSGTSTLYGPFEEDPSENPSSSAPSNAPIAGTATFSGTYDAEGNAEVETSAVDIDDAGYYTWVEELAPVTVTDDDGNTGTLVSGDSGEFGEDSETTVKVTPVIGTVVNDQHVVPGAELTDEVAVDGLYDSVGGKNITHLIDLELRGPVAPNEADDGTLTCDVDFTDAPIAHSEKDIDATGDLSAIGGFIIPEDDDALGCYSYGETLRSFVDENEDNNPDDEDEVIVTEHEVGKESQTSLVTKPEIGTQVSANLVSPGKSVHDEIEVTGTGGTPGVLTAKLYGYITPDNADEQCDVITDSMWRDAIEDGDVEELYSENLELDGDGTYFTKDVELSNTGCATWYESAVFTGNNDGEDDEDYMVETPYGVDTETTLVINPEINTTATKLGEFSGTEIYDTVELTGLQGNTATVSGRVLGPVNPINDSCEAVNWDGAPVLGEVEPQDVIGDGSFETKKFQTNEDAPGCYTFELTAEVESPGNTLDDSGEVVEAMMVDNVISEAGIPSETVMLKKEPAPEVPKVEVPEKPETNEPTPKVVVSTPESVQKVVVQEQQPVTKQVVTAKVDSGSVDGNKSLLAIVAGSLMALLGAAGVRMNLGRKES